MATAPAAAAPDPELTERLLRPAGIDTPVTRVSRLGDGVKAHVWLVEFGDREPLALKIYTRAGTARREHAAYRAAAGAGLSLPTILGGALAAESAPDGYTLMTIAPGHPMNLSIAELSRERLDAIYREIGGLLTRIARIECPSFGLVAGAEDGFASNAEFIDARLRASVEGFLSRGGNPHLARGINELFEQRAEALDACTSARLCHGDMHPENVRVDPAGAAARFVGAIDLEEAFAGDPALDIVRTIHTAPFSSESLRSALLEGYGETPPWLNEVYDAYFVYWELELWNFFAAGGSRRPLRSIARRIAKRLDVSRMRLARGRLGRVISR